MKLVLGEFISPTEAINLSLTQIGGNNQDIIGSSIDISVNSVNLYHFIWNGSSIYFTINKGLEYKVEITPTAGYTALSKTYLAELNNRNISIQCAVNGIYIESTEHLLYTNNSWDSQKEPNSIVILSSNCKIRLALDEFSPMPIHNNDTDPLENYITGITDINVAKANFNGKQDTDKIKKFNIDYNTFVNGYAIYDCLNYNFPDNTSIPFLPSMGHLNEIYLNKTEINSCLSIINATLLDVVNYVYYSSSTYRYITNDNKRHTWGYRIKDGDISNSGLGRISSNRPVRPIAYFE